MIRAHTEFKTILVPLDGSPHAEHALPHALSIARRNGATIRLALVHSPFTPTDDPYSMYHRDFLVDVDRERIRQKQDYLNSVVRRISRRDSVRVLTLLAEGERTVDQLSIAAQGAELIVMATHARNWLSKLWHGSMADSLLCRVDCPLLLVRGYHGPADFTGDPIPSKLLVPLDGSSFAEQILPATVEVARISGADVKLLHVDHIFEPQNTMDDPLCYLRSVSNAVKGKVPHVEYEVVDTHESPADAVLSTIRRQDIDLVALTTEARHGLPNLGRGSILKSVIRRSSAPVLVMRGGKTGEMTERTASSATAV
jgi:nucleotide-binding universal stress UspA family protein